ncbi:uncharacterized protein LOC141852097 [Brevipalpus obovatus]|uniref:uncharacterized protein LOC141852097 n=1 Tax=Brevipalpus obovatus TaxID=246614 RepID=UPI003D9E169D
MNSLSSPDDIPLPPSNSAPMLGSDIFQSGLMPMASLPAYPAAYPASTIYNYPTQYNAYVMGNYLTPQVNPITNPLVPDLSNPAALYSPGVPGYPYYSAVNSVTTDASNLIPTEKLSKKQRKKLAAEAALVSSLANSKSALKEGKPSHQMDEVDDDTTIAQGKKSSKANNNLPIWGNEKTMNLNPLLLTNIQNSPYFKVSLYALKTYHEVIDEIWYQVKHLEPWEKGSRRVGGQTGMCGSVRGVGAGGIVSTPFCILYKLYTLRLTRKQVVGLMKHKDSPFIRALGFLYVRYTQPPENLWDWFGSYLDDEEVFDPKAGGGQKMTIGDFARHLLTKLEWFSTLFPRIPVPVQKDIEAKLQAYRKKPSSNLEEGEVSEENEDAATSEKPRDGRVYHSNPYGRDEKRGRSERSGSFEKRSRSRSRDRHRHSRSRNEHRHRGKHRERSRSPKKDRSSRYKD